MLLEVPWEFTFSVPSTLLFRQLVCTRRKPKFRTESVKSCKSSFNKLESSNILPLLLSCMEYTNNTPNLLYYVRLFHRICIIINNKCNFIFRFIPTDNHGSIKL